MRKSASNHSDEKGQLPPARLRILAGHSCSVRHRPALHRLQKVCRQNLAPLSSPATHCVGVVAHHVDVTLWELHYVHVCNSLQAAPTASTFGIVAEGDSRRIGLVAADCAAQRCCDCPKIPVLVFTTWWLRLRGMAGCTYLASALRTSAFCSRFAFADHPAGRLAATKRGQHSSRRSRAG